MADLDDFFAKKDKKKSKAKPKFLTAEELVKNLEKEAATTAKSKKVEPTIPAPTITSGAVEEPTEVVEQAPEEEWDDFEQEQRKDYTGLKIGQLTLNDDEDESQGEGEEDDVDSDGNVNPETNSSKRSGGGPWRKVVPAEEVTQIPMEIEKPTSKLYISPALRAAQAGAAPGPRLKPRNRAAPDITNAEYFPSLSAARPEEQRKKKNEPAFEEVRHGGRVQRIHEPVLAPVTMANRFQSLDEDDS
ncbi:protein CDV3 homolog [Bactrocera neohumeralis]|uniref:protein CDV3 homolog n=1 Tax=Bactrocera tryoni TaxID=59916 RepID=UPI001A95E949|nr:protein CDV3 homolog [Bactrocera tryoni]XP_039953711.1 protein CDV3 homolog [Bactrocera tryoni]XP_039953712.1 protein CDV3 homolog [Bactrocera tryoni]XP_039953713.1 protein CDV3 homolog [Bactrocera tryoni]XP_050323878.1 protein CDV3 homolog [Bactrocera neohumeralis]